MTATIKSAQRSADGTPAIWRPRTALDRDALQKAIFNSSTFSSIATDAEGVIQIRAAGCNGYISKPLSYPAFRATIASELAPA